MKYKLFLNNYLKFIFYKFEFLKVKNVSKSDTISLYLVYENEKYK